MMTDLLSKMIPINSKAYATIIQIATFPLFQIIILTIGVFLLFHFQYVNVTLQQSESQNGDEQHIVTKELTSTEGKTGRKKSSIDSDSSKNGSTKKKSKKSKKSGDSEKENISVVSSHTSHTHFHNSQNISISVHYYFFLSYLYIHIFYS